MLQRCSVLMQGGRVLKWGWRELGVAIQGCRVPVKGLRVVLQRWGLFAGLWCAATLQGGNGQWNSSGTQPQ